MVVAGGGHGWGSDGVVWISVCVAVGGRDWGAVWQEEGGGGVGGEMDLHCFLAQDLHLRCSFNLWEVWLGSGFCEICDKSLIVQE